MDDALGAQEIAQSGTPLLGPAAAGVDVVAGEGLDPKGKASAPAKQPP